MSLNLDKCIEQLMRCEILTETNVKELCERMKEVLVDEPNVVPVKAPVTVVGDIHAQFYDLLEIFKIGGKVPDTNFLFLGNYINRGFYGVETTCLLICLKLRYPNRVTILRGNHESRYISQIYGFYGECVRKYGNATIWKYFMDMFDYLPIAAVVDDRIFCVHGGLSQHLLSVDQIRVLDRFMEVPTQPDAPLTELLWSDPAHDQEKEGFSFNAPRGIGCIFGQDTVQKFLKINKLDHISRSHQLCMDGYQLTFNNKLSSTWSAPNYCYRCGNVAAVLEIGENYEKHFNTFIACPDSEREKPNWATLKELPDYYTI